MKIFILLNSLNHENHIEKKLFDFFLQKKQG